MSNAPSPAERLGEFCTPATASREIFDRLYDPEEGRFKIERSGALWEAVEVAHEQGRFGRGRRITILDSGFDVELEPLRAVLDPESRVTRGTIVRRGNHGSVVALLIHEVAPEATLLLVEIAPQAKPPAKDVAAALADVSKLGPEIVNISLEFASDALPRDRSAIALDVVLSEDPPPGAFLEQVAAWLTITDPYAPGGCRWACPLCEELERVPTETLVVTAAGNTDRLVCPACSERCLGLGFQYERLVTREGRSVLARDLPRGYTQSLYTEFGVRQPESLGGTSFAAPLVSGFAAVVDDRADLAAMARLPFAMTPLLVLGNALADRGTVAGRAIDTLRRGYEVFGAAFPSQHRHWEHEQPGPCATCSLFAVEWYKGFLSLLIASGRADEAVRLGEVAAAVMPRSPGVAQNLAEARARGARLPA